VAQQQGNRGARQQAQPGQALILRPEDLNVFLTNQAGGEIARAIPPGIPLTAHAIIGQAVMAMRKSEKLQSCTHQTIAASVIYAAQVGLELATPRGYCWLIPYGKECTFQIGYKGLLALAYRSNKIHSAKAETVHKNDHFIYRQSSIRDEFEYEKRLEGDRGDWHAAFLRVIFKDGRQLIHVMRRDEIEEIRDKCSRSAYDTNKQGWSKTPEYLTGVWKDWPLEMAKKTVAKQGMKTLDLQPELALAIGADEEAMATGHQSRPPVPPGIIEVRSWEVIERAQLTAPGTPSTTAPPDGAPAPEAQPAQTVDPKVQEESYVPEAGKGLRLEVNFSKTRKKPDESSDYEWVLETVPFCLKHNRANFVKWMGEGHGNVAHINNFLRGWKQSVGAFLAELEQQRVSAKTAFDLGEMNRPTKEATK